MVRMPDADRNVYTVAQLNRAARLLLEGEGATTELAEDGVQARGGAEQVEHDEPATAHQDAGENAGLPEVPFTHDGPRRRGPR